MTVDIAYNKSKLVTYAASKKHIIHEQFTVTVFNIASLTRDL